MNISSEEDILYFREKLKKCESDYEKFSRDMKSAETENKSAVRFYENYLRTMQSDYDILYELAKRERAEAADREERELAEFMRREELERTDGRHYRR